ncbi:MAG: hypothetical protein IKU53_03520 [Firmicutes bacterium]|nr:hypothetical protein [Bacillota bacterium]
MREYQLKRLKDYKLPETVYRQALWAIKDVNRLKDELNRTIEDIDSIHSPSFVGESRASGMYSDITANKAEKIISLSSRIENIENALFAIPEKYRSGICNKLMNGGAFGDCYHPNTWKKWQQVYIFHVAKNLGIY